MEPVPRSGRQPPASAAPPPPPVESGLRSGRQPPLSAAPPPPVEPAKPYNAAPPPPPVQTPAVSADAFLGRLPASAGEGFLAPDHANKDVQPRSAAPPPPISSSSSAPPPPPPPVQMPVPVSPDSGAKKKKNKITQG
eukprot:gnl/TRDRNA2_/TRDRNA2_81419_c0_seq1.p2 gnl/TRDRNA2_/TRDRNA2_81419_c0~~gnl/TRDRNA2_/TRDRNA2_81419_c0_seq1.p2  ORF type:complete len:137 (+),score=27.54 gnl/TRDRNA2_/TRDRNA2_81419_c0_seq1:1-411(+)